VDVITALKAMTIWPAWQHYEEHWKGSIEEGKLADLVVLSADPTAVDPETLDQLKVLETIKDGETVFALESAGAASTRPPSNPAVARLLVALGSHGAASGHNHDHGHSAASAAGAAAPTCMSDGILHLATAMLGGFAATEE
jgi:urease alpha subunit